MLKKRIEKIEREKVSNAEKHCIELEKMCEKRISFINAKLETEVTPFVETIRDSSIIEVIKTLVTEMKLNRQRGSKELAYPKFTFKWNSETPKLDLKSLHDIEALLSGELPKISKPYIHSFDPFQRAERLEKIFEDINHMDESMIRLDYLYIELVWDIHPVEVRENGWSWEIHKGSVFGIKVNKDPSGEVIFDCKGLVISRRKYRQDKNAIEDFVAQAYVNRWKKQTDPW